MQVSIIEKKGLMSMGKCPIMTKMDVGIDMITAFSNVFAHSLVDKVCIFKLE